jgi:hypothetical protein
VSKTLIFIFIIVSWGKGIAFLLQTVLGTPLLLPHQKTGCPFMAEVKKE